MNRKKLISAIGAIALVLGVGMNLRYSLDDYGLKTNSLSQFVFAQSTSGGRGSSTGSTTNARTTKVKVTCTISQTITSTSGSSSGVSGGISGGIGGVSAGISGSTGSNTGSSTSTTTTETYEAYKNICEPTSNYVEICTPFDPCFP